MIKVRPYIQGSESAKAISRALNTKCLLLEGSKYVPKAGHTIINWGNGSPFPNAFNVARIINKPLAVANATNKKAFFRLVKDTPVPEWTTSKDKAKDWVNEGFIVIARTVLNGHAGGGIVVIENGEQQIPDAPLYTKYIPKKHEFRVHVCNGDIIGVQKKVAPDAQKVKTWRIRTHDNGFIFQRQNINVPQCVKDAAVTAIRECTLDFGGVDVIYSKDKEAAWVLEVNTAPGIEGQTVEEYANAFRKMVA